MLTEKTQNKQKGIIQRTIPSIVPFFLSGGLGRATVNYTYNGDLLTKLTHSNTSGKSTQYNFTYGALDLISEISIGTNEASARTLATYEYKTDDNSYNLSYQYGITQGTVLCVDKRRQK